LLTPQEVTSSEFEKALFGGYDIPSVDRFLNQLTQDYSALYRENGILKSKMKVLVDKVEEYRSTEDAMRMALLQAERTAKEITDAAEARRSGLDDEVAQTREALEAKMEAEFSQRREEIRAELAAEEAALTRAKRETAEYLEKLKAAMAAYAENLRHVYDFVEPLPPAEPEPAPEAPAAEPAPTEPEPEAPENRQEVSQDTVENIAEIINRAFSSMDAAEKPAEPPQDVDSTITRLPDIDFDNLQFGNYDPTKKS